MTYYSSNHSFIISEIISGEAVLLVGSIILGDGQFFFYQGLLAQTLTVYRVAREGRGPSFISLYHFHPLINSDTFICNFTSEMTIPYF